MRTPPKTNNKPAAPSQRARANTQLLQAASAGSVYGIRDALEQGADINTRDGKGRTPLLRAIGVGADASENPFAGLEALTKSLAPGGKIAPFVILLLNAGADVRLTDKEGIAALDFAALTQNTPLCRELIRRKADVNHKAKGLMTPLGIATLHRDTEIVDLLIKAGADPRIPALAQKIPLLVVAMRPPSSEREEENLMSLAGGLASAFLGGGEDKSVEEDTLAIMEKLIAAGANPNEVFGPGITPLMGAALFGTPRIVRLLLARGAKRDSTVAEGSTALHAAAAMGRADTARVLLEAGSNPNNSNRDGQTPLQLAAGAGGFASYSLVERLLAAGAKVDARDSQGKTARDIAVEKKNTAIVQLLDAHAKPK